MQLCLFRHASRNPHDPGDGGLSERGLEQAQAIPAHVSPAGPLPRPTHVLSSPKRRARQTFAPLGERYGLTVKVTAELDERGDAEPMDEFVARVRGWLEGLEASFTRDDVVFACSHLDVLEEMMGLIATDLAEFEIARGFGPAEYRLFQVEGGYFAGKAAGRA